MFLYKVLYIRGEILVFFPTDLCGDQNSTVSIQTVLWLLLRWFQSNALVREREAVNRVWQWFFARLSETFPVRRSMFGKAVCWWRVRSGDKCWRFLNMLLTHNFPNCESSVKVMIVEVLKTME